MKLLFAVILALCTVACVQTPSYEQVAVDLSEPDFPSSGHGYIRRWIPKGANYTYQELLADEKNIHDSLSACVSEYQNDIYPTPSVATVTAQLLQCMEKKSWVLSIEEIVVTD